jgi:predicted DNA-binding protein
MEQITLRLPSELLEEVEEEASEHDTSRSEYLRDVIESRHEPDEDAQRTREEAERLREESERLRSELDHLETQLERLRSEKQMILKQREENTELVKWADEQRSLQERRLRASAWDRLKWSLFGMKDSESRDESR